MSPPPRHVTSAPTVPPPDHTGGLAKRLADWRTIAGVLAAVFLAGIALWRWDAAHQTREDAAREAAAASAALDAVRTDVTGLRERVTRAEASLEWIKGALYEVAQKTGATSVPPPPP